MTKKEAMDKVNSMTEEQVEKLEEQYVSKKKSEFKALPPDDSDLLFGDFMMSKGVLDFDEKHTRYVFKKAFEQIKIPFSEYHYEGEDSDGRELFTGGRWIRRKIYLWGADRTPVLEGKVEICFGEGYVQKREVYTYEFDKFDTVDVVFGSQVYMSPEEGYEWYVGEKEITDHETWELLNEYTKANMDYEPKNNRSWLEAENWILEKIA